MKAALKNILSNLSFTKYEYYSIFPTALKQLDHLFLVIGNGYEYDSTVGICEDIRNGKPKNALIRKSKQDFEAVVAKYKRDEEYQIQQFEDVIKRLNQAGASEKLEKWMNEYRSKFGIPNEYILHDESYYFNPEAIAAEFIEYSIAENEQKENGDAYWSTPYPISEYSKITKVQKSDQPETVRLALATAKAWLIVLDYYKENGLYLTEDEVQSKESPLLHYKSLTFINQQYETLVNIITELEKDDA